MPVPVVDPRIRTEGPINSMWQVKLGAALGTVALTGLVGAGVGVGYYVVKANEFEERNEPRRG